MIKVHLPWFERQGNLINVIRAIREATGMSLVDAKLTADLAPVNVNIVSLEKAQNFIDEMKEYGIDVQIVEDIDFHLDDDGVVSPTEKGMKVFYCTSFTGHWPVGSCALVVAVDEESARTLLAAQLQARGLELQEEDEIKELDTSSPEVLILLDGNY